MMPMTPSGTRIWPTWMPDGRNLRPLISPMGSGSATIWRRPSTMVAMAESDRVRRSTSAGARPAATAASRSSWLAARSSAASRTMASAISSSARLRVALSARAIARDAARACWPTCSMYCLMSIVVPLFLVIQLDTYAYLRQLAARHLQRQLQHRVPRVAGVSLGAQALDHLVDLRRVLQRRFQRRQRDAPQRRVHHPFARPPDAVFLEQRAQWPALRHPGLQF